MFYATPSDTTSGTHPSLDSYLGILSSPCNFAVPDRGKGERQPRGVSFFPNGSISAQTTESSRGNQELKRKEVVK